MARSIAADRHASPRSLRERRIAVFSTPPATTVDDSPRLRWTVDQRCLALGVTLTEEWRALALIFDHTDMPMSAGEVWSHARAAGLKASRSHVYQLIRNLLALGVLIIAERNQTIRYAVPLALRMTVRVSEDQAPLAIEDANALEGLVAALRRSGHDLEGCDIAIELIQAIVPGPSREP